MNARKNLTGAGLACSVCSVEPATLQIYCDPAQLDKLSLLTPHVLACSIDPVVRDADVQIKAWDLDCSERVVLSGDDKVYKTLRAVLEALGYTITRACMRTSAPCSRSLS